MFNMEGILTEGEILKNKMLKIKSTIKNGMKKGKHTNEQAYLDQNGKNSMNRGRQKGKMKRCAVVLLRLFEKL